MTGGRHLVPFVTPGRCGYCGRRFTDRRGCDYLDDDPTPALFGDEGAPLPGDTCPACRVERGRVHHAVCSLAECQLCGDRFAYCGGVACQAGDAA